MPHRGAWWRMAIAWQLVLSAVAGMVAGAQSSGRITGVVRDSLGAVIAGATVSVAQTTLQATTDTQGAFSFPNVPVGRARLTVRRLGFAPQAVDVEVVEAMPSSIDVTLTAIALNLQPVEVRAQLTASDSRLAGFNRRKTQKIGHFLTREQIDQKTSRRIIDALRELPGIRVVSSRSGPSRQVMFRGQTCPPLVFIDGFPASAGSFDLDMIDLASIEGIEAYSSGSSVPSEFLGPRGLEQCGVIALWSRPFRPRQAPPPNFVVRDSASDVQALVARGSVKTAQQVDVPAVYQPGTAVPSFPDSLAKTGKKGRVVLEFVVDTLGEVELSTLGLVSSTNPALTDAVRQVIAQARFTPAILGKVPVRQVVRLAFEFSDLRS
jgi:TonB family protein